MKSEWIRVVRTALQVAVSVAPTVPVLIPAIGLSATAGVGAAMIAIAAVVTRVMSIPTVAELLNRYLKVPMP